MRLNLGGMQRDWKLESRVLRCITGIKLCFWWSISKLPWAFDKSISCPIPYHLRYRYSIFNLFQIIFAELHFKWTDITIKIFYLSCSYKTWEVAEMLFTGKKKIITVRFLNVLECYELMMRGGGGVIYMFGEHWNCWPL